MKISLSPWAEDLFHRIPPSCHNTDAVKYEPLFGQLSSQLKITHIFETLIKRTLKPTQHRALEWGYNYPKIKKKLRKK